MVWICGLNEPRPAAGEHKSLPEQDKRIFILRRRAVIASPLTIPSDIIMTGTCRRAH